jgi:hypothetical protein
MFAMRSKRSKLWWRPTRGPSAVRPWYSEETPEEAYYRSEEHFHEMPYKIGDRLPAEWVMHAAPPLQLLNGWPSYDRPIIYRGSDLCPICAGRGIILYGRVEFTNSGSYRVLDERDCDVCHHKGYAGARVAARTHGYSTVEEYHAALHAMRAEKRAKKRKEIKEQERARRLMRGGRLGWFYAERLFAPVHDYLHDEDKVMDWLYKVRALIGAFIVIAVGLHYHQPTVSTSGNYFDILGRIIRIFPAILGSISWPLRLAVFSVLPATAVVVLFTKPGRRKAAFDQMMRYPVKAMLICLAVYAFVWAFEYIYNVGIGNAFIELAVVVVVGLILLSQILFWFRAVYLLTVGMCRLGDGHPLLPPIIGTLVAWGVVFWSLVHDPIGSGEPAVIWYVILFGAPISVTALGIVEIRRLRAKYLAHFPFRDGPLPPNK